MKFSQLKGAYINDKVLEENYLQMKNVIIETLTVKKKEKNCNGQINLIKFD